MVNQQKGVQQDTAVVCIPVPISYLAQRGSLKHDIGRDGDT